MSPRVSNKGVGGLKGPLMVSGRTTATANHHHTVSQRQRYSITYVPRDQSENARLSKQTEVCVLEMRTKVPKQSPTLQCKSELEGIGTKGRAAVLCCT